MSVVLKILAVCGLLGLVVNWVARPTNSVPANRAAEAAGVPKEKPQTLDDMAQALRKDGWNLTNRPVGLVGDTEVVAVLEEGKTTALPNGRLRYDWEVLLAVDIPAGEPKRMPIRRAPCEYETRVFVAKDRETIHRRISGLRPTVELLAADAESNEVSSVAARPGIDRKVVFVQQVIELWDGPKKVSRWYADFGGMALMTRELKRDD